MVEATSPYPKYIASVGKAASVLKAFSAGEPHLGVTEIAERVGLPLTTVHSLVATLEREGLLERDNGNRKYSVGRTLYSLGSLYLPSQDLPSASRPILMVVAELTGELTNLGVRDADRVVLLTKLEATHPFRVFYSVGSSFPCHTSSMGKALLCQLSDSEIDALFHQEELPQLTPKTLPTRSALKRELSQIRLSGVAFDFEGTYSGVISVASPIKDADNRVVAALSVAAPAARLHGMALERTSRAVRLAGMAVGCRLGCLADGCPTELDIRTDWEVGGGLGSDHATGIPRSPVR